MINENSLQTVLTAYRKAFNTPSPERKGETLWESEISKWIAIKHFQKHWDIESENFSEMLKKAFHEALYLLDSMNNYPCATIIKFASIVPDSVREMFRNLYNESLPLVDRIDAFMAKAEEIRKTYGEEQMGMHYQKLNPISVYLWLRYPDKYYIYKYSECKAAAEVLGSDFKVKKNGNADIYPRAIRFYDEIAEFITGDKATVKLFQNALTDACYPDPRFRTLALDVGFYISRYYSYSEKPYWPTQEEYPVNITKEQWKQFILEVEMPGHHGCMRMLKGLFELGGEASCKKLSSVYGEAPSKYVGSAVNTGKRAKQYFHMPACMDGDTERFFPIPYQGRELIESGSKNYAYKMRDELFEALKEIDLTGISMNVSLEPDDDNEWLDYEPKLTKAEWIDYITHSGSFSENYKNYLKQMIDIGGQATCAQMAAKYGQTANHYIMTPVQMAKSVVEFTRCQLKPDETGRIRYWAVLFLGKDEAKEAEGGFIWKMRTELREALEETGVLGSCGYWWLNANPKIWSFSSMGVGEKQVYTLYNDNGNKRRVFQNFLDAKVGDVIICYESTPVKQIVAIAKVSKEQNGKEIEIEKVETLTTPIDYLTLRELPDLEKMEYFVQPTGSLFKLTEKEYTCIMDVIREENPSESNASKCKLYSRQDFLDEVYMDDSKYDSLAAVLRNKKNVILQGAPGVGKTYAAKRLAYSMMGEMDDSRVELIQFHQSYSYEDFVIGYRPTEDGFRLTNGIFYRFCVNAANQPNKDFFFIIDEINRGNMSKIFGELLMLIERDYRGTKATLAYSGMSFSVPKNVYIIGMMNTADRSLAMIDYALRRRFSFFDMEPGFRSDGFKTYQKKLNNETFDALIEKVVALNKEIKADESLGPGFQIGHSYFCGQEECSEAWLKEVVNYDIIPMLQEYWFDDVQKVNRWSAILCEVFNDN